MNTDGELLMINNLPLAFSWKTSVLQQQSLPLPSTDLCTTSSSPSGCDQPRAPCLPPFPHLKCTKSTSYFSLPQEKKPPNYSDHMCISFRRAAIRLKCSFVTVRLCFWVCKRKISHTSLPMASLPLISSKAMVSPLTTLDMRCQTTPRQHTDLLSKNTKSKNQTLVQTLNNISTPGEKRVRAVAVNVTSENNSQV